MMRPLKRLKRYQYTAPSRDAATDPRLPENRRVIQVIALLARRIRELERHSLPSEDERAVLHDALSVYYPEYNHKIEAVARNSADDETIIAFNPQLAIENYREELRWWRDRGGPYRGPHAVFFEGKPEAFDWKNGRPFRVRSHYTWEGRYGRRPTTWSQHGVVVYVAPELVDDDD